MKNTELRIGNYVEGYYETDCDCEYGDCQCDESKTICKVLSVDSVGITDHSVWVESEDTNTEVYERFEGILINEKWHNRFGVKYNNALSEYVYELPKTNNFNLLIVFSGDYIWLRQKGSKPVEDDIVSLWNKDLIRRDIYVHEWQNIYHALTGKELVYEHFNS